MSCIKQHKKEKQSVEVVARSTTLTDGLMEAFLWSINSKFQLQSSVQETTEAGGGSESHQTTDFVDNAVGETVISSAPVNPIAKVDNTDDIRLGEFLSRPTLIDTFQWTDSLVGTLMRTLQPWDLVMNNDRIRRKLDNYAFMRARLHVKVVTNGTPFQFGLARVCYTPMLGLIEDKIREPPNPTGQTRVLYSQQPGFFITPAANAGGQIELPFFYHLNWVNITARANVQALGTLRYVQFAPLAVAVASGPTDVTVQTYAWLTDVELMGSTINLALQGDEYGLGAVSRPASAIANFASYLTKVPIIGPFARATELGARAVGSIAQVFGYTNVPVIADIHAFHNMNAPMLASGHIGTPVQKLTLDPKQELSLDPSLHGLPPYDELALRHILTKESYVGDTTWATTLTPGTRLMTVRVNPSLLQQAGLQDAGAVTRGSRIYHTPMSYVNQMFSNWRGSIKFRFKVVGTKFHKGRMKISFDPLGDIDATNPDLNAVYTKIVDIGEEDDVIIEVPYHQAQAWLYTDYNLSNNWRDTLGLGLTRRNNVDNGVITLRVQTELTAPTSSFVSVLLFVSAGDDFEFANVRDHIGNETNGIVPSFFALQSKDVVSLEPSYYVMGTKTALHAERFAQNFGEAIGSLRLLLHRYMTLDTVRLIPNSANSITILRKTCKLMPYTPGYDPAFVATQGAKVLTAGSSNYAYTQMPHMAYVAGMYLGYRGGANYVLTPTVERQRGSAVTDIRVFREVSPLTGAGSRWGLIQATILDSDSVSTAARDLNVQNFLKSGLGGMAVTASQTNNSLTWQIPDLALVNFHFVNPSTYLETSGTDGTDRITTTVNVDVAVGATPEPITLVTHVAAAPDFTCLFWLCCPTLDYVNTIPTPV